MKVRDVMSQAVVTATTGTPLKAVAEILVDHGISGLPVVDADGSVVGVVSETDFVRKGRGRQPARPSWLAWLLGESEAARAEAAKVGATTAGEAMSSPAITIGPDEPVRNAAALMAGRSLNRLPVVDGGRLVGIVTRADLVHQFVRPDADIEQQVRTGIVRDTLWMDPTSLEVQVTDGVVRLSGTIDRYSTALVLERLISVEDGVIGVVNDLTWDVDDRRTVPAGMARNGA